MRPHVYVKTAHVISQRRRPIGSADSRLDVFIQKDLFDVLVLHSCTYVYVHTVHTPYTQYVCVYSEVPRTSSRNCPPHDDTTKCSEIPAFTVWICARVCVHRPGRYASRKPPTSPRNAALFTGNIHNESRGGIPLVAGNHRGRQVVWTMYMHVPDDNVQACFKQKSGLAALDQPCYVSVWAFSFFFFFSVLSIFCLFQE